MKYAIVAVLSILLLCTFAQAEEITFEWNQVIPSDMAGWKLYSASQPGGPYTPFMDLSYSGNPAGTYSQDMTIPEVVGNPVDYYFVLTAYDTEGNESGFSNEVKWTAEDTTAPTSPQTLTVTVKQQ